MKKTNAALCLLMVCCIVAGCATPGAMMTASFRETSVTDYAIKTPRPDGYGTVCIYRPKGFAGCGSDILIHHNFAVVGASACGTYFYYHLPQGKQAIWAEFMHRGSIEVDVKPDETIYLLFDFSSDLLAGAYPKFVVVPEAQAKAEMAGFKYITYKPLR